MDTHNKYLPFYQDTALLMTYYNIESMHIKMYMLTD